MKVLVIVALFAFVAVQVCQSAPVPDDDKVDNADKKEVAPAVDAVSDVPVSPAALAEKSEPAVADVVAVKDAEAATPIVEEKKDAPAVVSP